MDEQGNNHKNTGNTMSNGYVETSKADRAVWLMKCPPVVSRCLGPSDGSDPSRPVAKVILSIDPLHSNDEDSPTQFTMELAATESGNIPKCYTMDMSTDFIPMSVFSESSQGKISLEGKILNKFDMRPHNQNLETYAKLCRERTNKYMKKTRQIQVIDNDSGAHMRPMPGMMIFSASGPTDKKKMPTKGTEMKRTRRDRKEMEEIIFKLFERQSNWSLRNLIQETDQPEQFLKDILKDLCVYNNKGINQGTYELKPEYRRTSG
ncbi:putative Transcription initiation factor IIF subunit beta [Quillaja saponaria]|uniref:Transcription initiation factor IIF subunit beta n=1 Tax=Quillaja saponaria TaxID=32244 RepID=A0AAD7PWI5_QUISA|nr:putative Transcription initiation factor IIF subunit beta [Quillaja saponaria]KAJ7970423.1 putative Transcription initiation factor IIF subunit beta [Quillaja saponaria]